MTVPTTPLIHLLFVLLFALPLSRASSSPPFPNRNHRAVYEAAALRRGISLKSGCGATQTPGLCKLAFYQRGTLSTLDDIEDPCWKQCHGLKVDCDLACADAVALDEIDTTKGCGCYAPRYAAKQARGACHQACRKGTATCIAGCKKGRLDMKMKKEEEEEEEDCEALEEEGKEEDEKMSNTLKVEIDWTFMTNGTCRPICGTDKAVCGV